MAKELLAEAGFYFDELNKLRVLEPDVSQKTTELKEECKEFVDSKHRRFCHVNSAVTVCTFPKVTWPTWCEHLVSFIEIGQFQKVVGGLVDLVDELAVEAETEKMKVSLTFEATAPLLLHWI